MGLVQDTEKLSWAEGIRFSWLAQLLRFVLLFMMEVMLATDVVVVVY